MGLSPVTNVLAVSRYMDGFLADQERKAVEALSYAGEDFVNNARGLSTYKDRTGNLRSSIGYAVLKDGEVVKKNLQGTAEGQSKAEEVIAELKGSTIGELALIGFAGMEYAAAVESRGYDVISGSVPLAKALVKELKKVLAVEKVL